MNYSQALKAMEVEPGQSVMVNMDEAGDTKITWDPAKKLEVDIARGAFVKAKKEGYMAYKVSGKEGVKGELMHAFDPEAERIILAPPLAGGR